MEQMTILGAAIGFGVVVSGFLLCVVQVRLFLENSNKSSRRVHRASQDWLQLLVLWAWFFFACVFAGLGLVAAVQPALGAEHPLSLAILLASGLAILISSEVYCVHYAPHLGIARRLDTEIALLQLAQAGDGRAFAARVRAAGPVIAAVARGLLRHSDHLVGQEPSRQAAASLRLAWWSLVLAVMGVVVLRHVPTISARGLLAAATAVFVVAAAIAQLRLFRATQFRDFMVDQRVGYVQKTQAFHRQLAFNLPQSQVARLDSLNEGQVISRPRLRRARFLAGLAGVLTAAVGTNAAVQFAHDPLARQAGSLLMSFASFLLGLFMLYLSQRRVQRLWEDVGLRMTSRLSQQFMRESAHQVKNMLEPIDRALTEAAGHLAASPPEDPQEARFVEARLQAGRRCVVRMRKWLTLLRDETQRLEDRRRRWFSTPQDVWIPLDAMIVDLVDAAIGLRGDDHFIAVSLRTVVDGRQVEAPVRLTSDRDGCMVVTAQPAGLFAFNTPTICIDTYIWADVVSNLLRNGFEAIREKKTATGAGHEIELAVIVEHDDAYPITFAIRDTGPGIPTGQRDTIFDPSFSSKRTGMGLGLFMVREFILHLGGRVYFTTSAADDAETFTSFVVDLPLRRVNFGSGGVPQKQEA